MILGILTAATSRPCRRPNFRFSSDQIRATFSGLISTSSGGQAWQRCHRPHRQRQNRWHHRKIQWIRQASDQSKSEWEKIYFQTFPNAGKSRASFLANMKRARCWSTATTRPTFTGPETTATTFSSGSFFWIYSQISSTGVYNILQCYAGTILTHINLDIFIRILA